MKSPSESDFRAHALVVVLKHGIHGLPGSVGIVCEAMKFGYSLALFHATDEVAKASKDLREFRERNNAPK